MCGSIYLEPIPLAKGDTLTQARARQQETRRAHADLAQIQAELGMAEKHWVPTPEELDCPFI